ncbi:MAG TPA: prephenate dehydrogenase/arogenate dehydrogenase family protein [Longimicrobiales bacterium]|nr:prephenate dehydrogenase/arogenate dehydrogenase family protein [Longimicrobiales bacterium]
MSDVRTVAIVGLGLIGGSLARDLTARGMTVMGRDADRKTERDALDEGAIGEIIDDEYAAIERAHWLVLAVPVGQAADVLARARAHATTLELVTDTGSTKLHIERVAVQCGLERSFVGSHPLAGDHRAGWRAARAGLFADARAYICPAPGSSVRAVAAAEELWRLCGARPERIAADAHDRLLARTSHLPQLVASILALTLRDSSVDVEQLGPGGRDMVRLAASSPELWSDITRQNAANIRPALALMAGRLAAVLDALAAGDDAVMDDLFRQAQAWRGRQPGDPLAAAPEGTATSFPTPESEDSP